jgi:CHAT domain-containing protein
MGGVQRMRAGWLTGITLFLGIQVFGQSLIKSSLDSAIAIFYTDFERTELWVQQAEQLILSAGAGDHAEDLIRCYTIRMESCNAFDRFRLWRQHLNKADSLIVLYWKNLGEVYDRLRLELAVYRGRYLYQVNDHAQVLELFFRLLPEYQKQEKSYEVCENLFLITHYIAMIQFERGEYEASINQHTASLRYLECVTRSVGGLGSYAILYRNIALAYFEKREYTGTRRYLKLAEESLQPLLKQQPLSVARTAISLYETQASYYRAVSQFDSALIALEKAIPLLQLPGVNNSFKGRVYFSLGDHYMRQGNLAKAESEYARAGYFFSHADEENAALADLHLSQSRLKDKQRKPDEALRFCDMAIAGLVLDFNPDQDGNPALNKVLSNKRMFAALQHRSRLFEKRYHIDRSTSWLQKAYATNHLALALLDSTASDFSFDEDKIVLTEQSYGAYEDGIRMAILLHEVTGKTRYLDECFRLLDKSKGILLLDKLRLVTRFSGLNEEWLIREKELKSEMLVTEKALHTASLQNNQGEVQSSRERLASIKRDYSTLMDKVKRESPDYFRLRYDRDPVSIDIVQKELVRPGEALIEYFVGDSLLAIVGISATKKFVRAKKIGADFSGRIERLRRLLVSADDYLPSQEFYQASGELYDLLLKDCLLEFGNGVVSITLIPDGLLGYLPFEVLTDSTQQLPNRRSFRYGYSSTYLHELAQKKLAPARYFFAGFVAESGGGKYAQLPGARKEVEAITQLLARDYAIFDPADKKTFIERAADYRVLHLAMHSVVNDQNPMMSELVFSSDGIAEEDQALLTAIELYNLKLNADIVVLSACETGLGQLHRGEGIMSFSRAFAYAGASSAVISLWKVPDKATSRLMVYFYQHLGNRVDKDEALRLAKRDFVEHYPQMAHPYYWAGFILTGDTDALDFPLSTSPWWYVMGAALLLALLVARKKARAFRRISG